MTEVNEPISLHDQIKAAIAENDAILFMKGTPEQPMCGFSARTVAALEAIGKPYAAVNVLEDPQIREDLSSISQWPTIPQLFVKGELVGGCDIVTEMFESGELAQALGAEGAETSNLQQPTAPPQDLLEIENNLDSGTK